MKLAATADWHGNLPEIPECDLLIIAGDVCPEGEKFQQRIWLRTLFKDHLRTSAAKEIVWIAGNHDFICEEPGFYRTAEQLPGHYLRDELVEVDGLKVYGTPWVPNLPGWAFYKPDSDLADIFDRIPSDTNILVSHGPPSGFGDRVGRGCVGNATLATKVRRIEPRFHFFGHVHEGFGEWEFPKTTLANVSYVNEYYEPVNHIVEYDLEENGKL